MDKTMSKQYKEAAKCSRAEGKRDFDQRMSLTKSRIQELEEGVCALSAKYEEKQVAPQHPQHTCSGFKDCHEWSTNSVELLHPVRCCCSAKILDSEISALSLPSQRCDVAALKRELVECRKERIEQTEQELRNLQGTCRDLIFRTAVKGRSVAAACPSGNHAVSSCSIKENGAVPQGVAPGADPEDPEGGRKFLRRVWRFIKAHFQVALLALLCFVCLVEPRCCDAMNNFGLSFCPQLRYVRGPPPV